MPSTFVHGFLPASCAVFAAGPAASRRQRLLFFAVCFIVGNLPDLDLVPTLIDPSLWEKSHRNWGHNIFALLFWTGFGAALFRGFSGLRPRRAWLTAAPLVASHVFLDAMSAPPSPLPRTGVPLFWPLSATQYSFPWVLFRGIFLRTDAHPLYEHLISIEYWTRLVFLELFYGVLLFGTWYAGIKFLQLARRKYPPSAAKATLSVEDSGRANRLA